MPTSKSLSFILSIQKLMLNIIFINVKNIYYILMSLKNQTYNNRQILIVNLRLSVQNI